MENTSLREKVAKLGKLELEKLLVEQTQLNKDNLKWLKKELDELPIKRTSNEYYKKKILRCFADTIQLGIARNVVSEFKKSSSDEAALIDLMIFYVETGTNYSLKYGDMYEAFYNSMESMYKSALELLAKPENKELVEKFKPRIYSLVEKTNKMGWGYHDVLCDWYEKYLKEKHCAYDDNDEE